MKKGTKIKTKQTRFEKVHKEQWIYGLLYRDECFKPNVSSLSHQMIF
jgi:hypothetical protein